MPDHLCGSPCPKCQTPLDVFGDHAVCCKLNHISQRHMALQDTLMGLVQSVGLACKREAHLPLSAQRPGDLFIPRWDANGPVAVDVTIRHHQAPSGPLTLPDRLLEWQKRQETSKEIQYRGQCGRQGWQFVPFLMDTWCGLAPKEKKFASRVVHLAVSDRLGWLRRQKEASIWQLLSMAPVRLLAKQLRLINLVIPDPVASAIGPITHLQYL